MSTDDNRLACVWEGCSATVDTSNWKLWPLCPGDGWVGACGIPPDDRDGVLCPLHGAAFEEWAYEELAWTEHSTEH
jgi:hypothetical protein